MTERIHSKRDALQQLRNAVDDHFSHDARPVGSTETVRYWIRICRGFGASEQEINTAIEQVVEKCRRR